MTSYHYSEERKSREALIQSIGLGKHYATFKVDRGHRNGAELHVITTTGIIMIYNARTSKMITKFVARPGQIKRYWPNGNYPQEIVSIAIKHSRMSYNLI